MPQTYMSAGGVTPAERKVQEHAAGIPNEGVPVWTMQDFYAGEKGDTLSRFNDESYLNEDPIFFRDQDHLEIDNNARDLYGLAEKESDPEKKQEYMRRLRSYEMWRQGRAEQPYEYIKRDKRKEHVRGFDKGAGINYLKMLEAGPDHAHEHMPEEKAQKWNDNFIGLTDVTPRKQKALITGLMGAWYNKPTSHVSKNYAHYRQSFFEEMGLQGQSDDNKVFGEAKRWLNKRVKQAEVRGLVEDATLPLVDSAILKGMSAQQTIKVTTDALVDQFGEDAVNRPMIAQASQSIWKERVQQFAPVISQARRMYENAIASMDDESVPLFDSDRELLSLVEMDREDRRRMMGLVMMMAEEGSVEYGEGFPDRMAERLIRSSNDQVFNVDFFGERLSQYLVNKLIPEDAMTDQGGRMRAAEEKLMEVKRETVQDLRDIKDISRRIESDNKLVQMMYDSAASVPFTLTAAIPGGGGVFFNALAMGAEDDQALRHKAPDLDSNSRFEVAMAKGATKSLIERAAFRAMIKPFPKIEAGFKKLGVRGTTGTAAGRITGAYVTEYTEEVLQQVSDLAIEDVAGIFHEEIPDVSAEEWQQSLGELNPLSENFDSRTALAVLPMAVLFGGGSTAIDRIGAGKARELLGSVDSAWLLGASKEDAQSIAAEKDVLKAHKMLVEAIKSKTAEERKANSKQAEEDGAHMRLQAEEIRKNGTETEKARLEEYESDVEFYKQHEARIEPTEDGQFKLIYPETMNKPNDFFDSEQEAVAQLNAHKEDVAKLFDDHLATANQQLEAMQEAGSHLDKTHEGRKQVDEHKHEQPIEFAQRSAENMQKMLERVQRDLNLNGVNRKATVEDIKQYRILGDNMIRKKARGYVARLAKNANVSTVIEEGAEGFIKDLTMRGDESVLEKDWVKQQILLYNQAAKTKVTTAESVEEMSDQDMVEAFSDMAMANFWNSRQHEQLPSGLRGIINGLRRFFLTVMEIAADLKQLRAEGKLGKDFETLLDQAIGINMDEQVSRMTQETQQEIAEEIEEDQQSDFSIAPNGAYEKGGWWHHATDNQLKGGKLKRFAGGSDSDMGGIFLVDDSDEGKRYSAGYGNKMYRVQVDLEPDQVFNLGNEEHRQRVEPIELDDAVGTDFLRNADDSAREGTLDWTAIEPELLEEAGFKAAILYERPSGMYGENPVRSLSVFDEDVLTGLEEVPADEVSEIREFKPVNTDQSFSITPAQDAAYMQAVESGDVETQQKMVDEAARAAGYDSPKVYHGTDSEFDAFIPQYAPGWGTGIYFTDNSSQTKEFGSSHVSAYLRILNPITSLTPEVENALLDTQTIKNEEVRQREAYRDDELDVDLWDMWDEDIETINKAAREAGYDGFIEEGSNNIDGTEFVVFSPSQVKSADPITYDSSGNVIPLSERFNEQDDRITHSIKRAGDPVVDRIHNLMRNDSTRLVVYRRMVERLGRVREQAYARQMAMTPHGYHRDDAKEAMKDMSTREIISANIAQLEAIRSVLPPEVRAKIGGARKMTEFKSIRGLENYLVDRIEMIDKHMETFLRDQFVEHAEKLIEQGTPKKGKNEKVAKGKISPEAHKELREIVKVVEMTEDELADAIDHAELDLAKAEQIEEEDKRDEAVIEAQQTIARLSTYGNLKSKKNPISAQGAMVATEELEHLIKQGKTRAMLRLVQQKEHRQGLKRMALDVIEGGKGRKLRSGRLKADESSKAKKFLRQEHARNISFEMMLNVLSRGDVSSDTMDSFLNRYFGEAVHKATHGESIAVNQKRLELMRVVAALHGITEGKLGWQQKVEDVMASMSERHQNSGIFLKEQVKRKVLKAYRAEVEALVNGEIDVIHDGYGWRKLSKREIAEFKTLLNKDNSKKRGQPKQNFEITVNTDGVLSEQYMSQDSAMFLTMMWRQHGLRPAMEAHGYNEETMKQFEKFLTRESKLLRTWLFRQYDQNHDYFNQTYKKMFGVDLVKVKNYAPAKSIHGGRAVKDMIDSSHGKQSTTPGMAMERIQHQSEPRYDVGAIQAYLQHVDSTEHFVHWAEPVAELRSVFMDKDVREAIYDHHGREIYDELIERIDMFADGGNVKAKTNRYLDHLRQTFTIAKLSYNWGVFLKQLTSLPAYSFDMPVKDFVKYEAEFFKDFGKNWKKMWNLPYVQNRFDAGYDRDVMAVIGQMTDSKGKLHKLAEFGMITGRAGDIIPVIVGGYASYRYNYEKAKKAGMTDKQAEARAVLSFEMTTDRAQQSGNLKDQSSYGLGGSLYRVFTMFQTSPRQYYSNMAEAILDAKAGRKGGVKRAAKAAFIAQVVLPSLFYWMSAATRNLPRDEEDRDELDDLLKGWAAAMALGPFSGFYLWGQIAGELASGFEYSMPVFEFGKEAMNSQRKLTKMWESKFDEDDATQIEPSDIISVVDSMARTVSLAAGKGKMWYDIGTRISKSVGFTQKDLERTLMTEVEGHVHDLSKVQNELYKENKLPDRNEDEDAYEDAKEARYEMLAAEYQIIKDQHPHLWDEIAKDLKEKGKLPEAVEELLD